ncbi:MAG: hypothetical protein JRD93_05620 [Deltaproteobacteria bacterium]|nr:hypothetical protein [Deltaproteobacteria bacterium]
MNQIAQVPPLEKGVRGISIFDCNYTIKTIFFVYLVINTTLFKSVRFILFSKREVEIPLSPPFTKGGRKAFSNYRLCQLSTGKKFVDSYVLWYSKNSLWTFNFMNFGLTIWILSNATNAKNGKIIRMEMNG